MSWDFFGLPPEVNSARLMAGPGPAPMMAAASAYMAMSDAFNLAAGGSDGSMNSLSSTYQGDSANRTQGAFRHHASWLREHAGVAMQTAQLATAAAAAYSQAYATMPPLPLILANRAVSVALAATNQTGQNTPAIMLNEAAYMAMWAQAAAAMTAYAGQSEAIAGALPPTSPPPQITGALGGSGGHAPGSGALVGGSSPVAATPAGYGPDAGPSGGDSAPSGGGDAGPSGGDTGPSGGESGPSGPGSEPDPALSDVDQPMSSMQDALADPTVDQGADWQEPSQHGFSGTTPYSTTLAGLSGGGGSMVALGMARGGLGSMAGASTGFRMPNTWAPASGAAFGAGTGAAPAAPASSPGPRRGVSAPASRMRRRRNDDEERSAKVFVPGAEKEIPVLERPPDIGVLQYEDHDTEEPDQPILVGVLERFDAEETTTTPEERSR